MASGNVATLNFAVNTSEVTIEVDYAHPPSERDKAEAQDICNLARLWLKTEFKN